MRTIDPAMLTVAVVCCGSLLIAGCARTPAPQEALRPSEGADMARDVGQPSEPGGDAADGTDLDPDDVGIPLYPGADYHGGGYVKNETVQVISAKLTTDDAFEKVAEFYKGEFPDVDPQEISGAGSRTLIFRLGPETDMKTVTIMGEDGQAEVNVGLMSMKKPAAGG